MLSALLGLAQAISTPAGIGILGTHFEPGEAKNSAFAVLGASQPIGFIAGLILGEWPFLQFYRFRKADS